MAGQQCCYDNKAGKLAVTGEQAGTPDTGRGASGVKPDGSCASEKLGLLGKHIFTDYLVFDFIEGPFTLEYENWPVYNTRYPPSRGIEERALVILYHSALRDSIKKYFGGH